MKARLKRLVRLERIRAIAKREAAAETARAECTLAQLTALAGRSRALAESYHLPRPINDAADLRSLKGFAAGVQAVADATTGDMQRARALADGKMADLAAAERRRSSVEERATTTAREMARRAAPTFYGARAKTGTELD